MGSINDTEVIIEALLFASGDPVPLDKIAEIIGHDKRQQSHFVKFNLQISECFPRHYVKEINNAYQLCTKPELDEYVQQLGTVRRKQGLTPQAYETLSIVAYNQPVTRAYIEQIRGVNSDGVLAKLIERNLIEEVGRDDTPGKPKLYATTEEFLRVFGFSSLKELPPLAMNEIPEVYENVPMD